MVVLVSPPGFQSPSSVSFWEILTGSHLLKQKYSLLSITKQSIEKGIGAEKDSFITSSVFLRQSQWQLVQCGLISVAQCPKKWFFCCCLAFFFFFATIMACGSSRAKDQIYAAVVACATAAAMLDP